MAHVSPPLLPAPALHTPIRMEVNSTWERLEEVEDTTISFGVAFLTSTVPRCDRLLDSLLKSWTRVLDGGHTIGHALPATGSVLNVSKIKIFEIIYSWIQTSETPKTNQSALSENNRPLSMSNYRTRILSKAGENIQGHFVAHNYTIVLRPYNLSLTLNFSKHCAEEQADFDAEKY